MQLPKLITKLGISQEEIPTQLGLKELILMSFFTDTRVGKKRLYPVALTFQMLSEKLFLILDIKY